MPCCKNLNTAAKYLSNDSLSKNLTCFLNNDPYRIAHQQLHYDLYLQQHLGTKTESASPLYECVALCIDVFVNNQLIYVLDMFYDMC